MADHDPLAHIDNPVARLAAAPVRLMQVAMGWVLIALCLATSVEILGRKLFGFSLQGVNEIGAYVLAVSSTWGFSAAMLQRAHARVDFLFVRFPPGMQAVLNVLAAVMFAGLAIFSAVEGWNVLKDTLRWQATANTPLQTPLWIPQSLWLAGLVVFSCLTAAMAAHALVLLFRDHTRLNRFYGPPSLQEQIEIETQGTVDLPAAPPSGDALPADATHGAHMPKTGERA